MTHYELLQVQPTADTGVIHAAYRLICKNVSESLLPKLNAAKTVLLDKKQRAEYDKELFGNPKIIGNYKILSKISAGGFGTTYKAEHISLKTPVCIKHALHPYPEDEEIMVQEAQNIWDLRHFAIPSIRDIIKMKDGSVAIVMSYIPGPTLGEVIEKSGPIDPEHVCWIADRILNALKYIHFHGVVHGDVKPQNIIIQEARHTVVLVDYGLSIVRPTATTESKGHTPIFASPEQEKSRPLLPESDLFSLGVTMIYALGGDVATRQVPADTPDALCKFIKQLIVYDVLSRPNWSKTDLCKDLGDIREECFGRRYSGMKPLNF